ncbi:hypothetical protein UFOVP662_59 [uncultured Caudovirales phage]|uniref:Uncharacterized protein n=1 Tax=uncultured Caudovirales phage TaxID=2100421 RepID=A0A6J5NHN4_9CAUD|nr:hypothetical protein UFOVP662_59 [uncultured Caudovirales phage]CAB4181670.1 hypothetical protein UFOVP1067_59 [uncultured Caudovirales phage]
MADAWQTYAFEFKGGLVSNLSPLQQGTQLPGSARLLKNFEPSTEGGYRRIQGFAKYVPAFVPAYGEPKVQGSGQTGTSLTLANIYTSPVVGDSFTVSGVAGTYTIAASGITFNSTNKTATLVLTTSLASSPSDKASVTFTTHQGIIKGVAAWQSNVLAFRNNDIYKSNLGSWVKINKPYYNDVLVNGAGQTGTTLAVDAIYDIPQAGDTFTIAGVEKVYTVLTDAVVVSGAATLSISPALASSPANNAAVTWLSANYINGLKLRTSKYRIGLVEKIIGVDGVNYPFIWDGTTFTMLNAGPTDVLGAEFVTFHKNQMFFSKGDKLTFTAPYTDSDFSAAAGSGTISVGNNITGIIVFREALIIFTERTISQLTGNTLADFSLQTITRNVGCIASDTIQEVSGDVIFLGPDGLRLLGATDRVGDFNIGVVSKPIQTETTDLITSSSSFSSVIIKHKSQYRLFGYNANISAASSIGILGTQTLGDSTTSIAWGETIGIKAYVADSEYSNQVETIVFAHTDGYVYKMESGNSFDGSNITASFATPYVYMNDPFIRKTFYKLNLYLNPVGSVTVSSNLKLDFDDLGSVQPETINLSNVTGNVSFYGTSLTLYGTSVYGSKLQKQFKTQVIGSGFAVSLQFISNSQDPPCSFDAATIEYATHDRR